jgi:diamine N-acetyltransferase
LSHTTTPELPVTLREITADTVDAVIKLSVADRQKRFVAPNAVSLAQSIFAPEAWYRAIHFGDEPAGFVMLYDESLRSPPPMSPRVAVWRFMVAEQYQGKGVGSAAMRLVIEHVRSKGFSTLELSYVPAEGSPEPFYLSHGFRNTDRTEEGERVMELSLGPA